MEQDEKLLSPGELAEALGVKVSWVYEQSRLKRRTKFPVLKFGKYLRFSLSAVKKWAMENGD